MNSRLSYSRLARKVEYGIPVFNLLVLDITAIICYNLLYLLNR